MQDSKPMDSPVNKSLSLSRDMCPKTPEEKEKMSRILYASNVGSLMHAMMCTRPNICYTIGLVNRYQSKALDGSQVDSTISEKNFRLHAMLPRKKGFAINRLL